jgi:alanyl-tRNA synthetase
VDLLTKSAVQDGVRVIRKQSPEYDAEYVKLLASRVSAAGGDALALIASTHEEPASVVMARGADLKFSCGELMKNALVDLGLRGGGSPTLAQGQVPSEELRSLFDRLEAGARAAGTEPAGKH